MSRHCLLLLLVLACCLLEISSRPNNESNTSEKVTTNEENDKEKENYKGRSRNVNQQIRFPEGDDENTSSILEKIKAINDGLKKPERRHQINYNNGPTTGGSYILDEDILRKIQEVIASGKLHGLKESRQIDESDYTTLSQDLTNRYNYARALQYLQPTITNNGLIPNQGMVGGNVVSSLVPNQGLGSNIVPLPYVTSIPVMVMPNVNNAYSAPVDNDIDSLRDMTYQTRQRPPSLPFQIQWPLAPFFPILIKDPLLHYFSTGGFNNLFEYGQNADVCNRKQKSNDSDKDESENSLQNNIDDTSSDILIPKSRQGRAIKKRTIAKSQNLNDITKANKFFLKPTTTPSTVPKKPFSLKQKQKQTTKSSETEGDLRFPFSDFTFFGNRRPVAPSPGFFINRLKVRRGGVAIAGPGGVATAGRGGTAIVGPGGLAYTQPGGLAVAGPAAKVVALSHEADLNSIVSRLQQQSATDDSTEEQEDGEDGDITEARGSIRDQTNTNTKDLGL